MDDKTASTANSNDAGAAADSAMPEGANDLGVELTAEQEAAFVDAQLGSQPTIKTSFGAAEPVVQKPAEGESEEAKAAAEKEAADKVAADKAEADKKAAEAVKPKPVEKPEEQKPTEIAAVETNDLWVDVEALTTDDEGKPVPKTFRLTLDGSIPDEMRFKNDKQLYEVMDAMREMRDILTERQADHDKQVTEQEQSQAATAAEQATLNNWQEEDNQLVEAGLLDAPKAKPANGTEYTPEEVAADPALQLRDDIYKYMISENEKRTTEGKPKIASFATAFTLFNKTLTADADAKAKAEADAKAAEEAELIKKRGAMVGGGSSSSGGAGKPFVYRAGSAKSIWSVPTDDI